MSPWTTAHGKRIEFETLETPHAPKAKAEPKQPYAAMSLDWAAKVAKRMKAPQFMILVVLAHLARARKSMTVSVSNEMLSRYGIDRHTKYRVLTRLETVGIVRVHRQGQKSWSVTLLVWPVL